MTLGERIASHRKALGISQEELGARLGVSRQAVSKWETSAAVPDMENLLALSREFGVSVAELTGTPEADPAVRPAESTARRAVSPAGASAAASSRRELVLPPPAMAAADGPVRRQSPLPATDFALLWTDGEGHEAFLELGDQEGPFPFGRELVLTEPEDVRDTDYHLTTLHRADCGAVTVEYLHTEADPEREQAEKDSITELSTIAAGVWTPRGIGWATPRADVTMAYGDDLVYCLKEEDSYTLVRHDDYYAYQTAEQPASALLFFLRDGLVAGIRVESTGDLGLDAYAPNNVTRFPVVDGEPDFSQRQEPEREAVSDTRRVYIAWNQLVTNDNLSAEELIRLPAGRVQPAAGLGLGRAAPDGQRGGPGQRHPRPDGLAGAAGPPTPPPRSCGSRWAAPPRAWTAPIPNATPTCWPGRSSPIPSSLPGPWPRTACAEETKWHVHLQRLPTGRTCIRRS